MVLIRPAVRRALIAGTGSIGRRHVATPRALGPALDVARRRAEGRRDESSRDLNAPVFADLEAARNWQPDFAVVATPSDRHAELIAPLLDAKIPAFIEKPVVIGSSDVSRLSQRTAATDPVTQVGCVLRFVGAVEVLRSWLGDGRLGRIARARLECGQYLPDWRPDIDYRLSYSADVGRGGGVVFDLVHELDLAVMLLGADRVEHALLAKRSSLELSCEDVALLHLRGADDVPIAIDLDYVARTPIRVVQIVGDEGSATLDFIGRRLLLTGRDGIREDMRKGFNVADAYRSQFVEFLDAIETGSPTRIPLAEGLRATRLAIAAHRSPRRGEVAS